MERLARQVSIKSAWLLILLMLVLTGMFLPPSPGFTQGMDGEGPVVDDIRVAVDGQRTRMVFDLNDQVAYRWFTLPQPGRLVIDFQENVHFAAEPAKVDLPDSSLVKALRAGKFRPGTVRMVMDLSRPAKISVFTIPADGDRKHRLVVDVMAPLKGEKPTNVPPPADVVTSDAAPPVSRSGKPLPAAEVPVKDVPLPPRSVETKRRDGEVIVVLDPGHGGVDPGALGRSYGTMEKRITLAMAKRVRDELRGENIRIIMTRDTDIFIPLPDRVRIAQRANADLFVSLHADSAPNRSVTGATVYMVSTRASDREAQRLAERENDGDVLAGVALDDESKEVQNILISLVQRDTMNNSAYLGHSVLRQLDNVTEVRKKNLLFAGFRVLKAPDVPSILVEMGYLSNPREEKQLNDARYQAKLASSIAQGIRQYVKEHVHRP